VQDAEPLPEHTEFVHSLLAQSSLLLQLSPKIPPQVCVTTLHKPESQTADAFAAVQFASPGSPKHVPPSQRLLAQSS
jgi:hypothetical protein